MANLNTAFLGLTDLQLWLKNQAGDQLSMANVSGIIPLRYLHFRDNWEFIKSDLYNRIDFASDPDRLKEDIISMSSLIEVQRSSSNQNVNPFSKSSILTDFYAVFDNILISELPITKEEQTIITNEVNRVSAFIKTDFRNIRAEIVSARDDLADEVGGSDDNYNESFRRSSTPTLRDINIKDVQNMQQLQIGIRGIDLILANATTLLDTISVDPFQLARDNANNPNLQIEQGRSGRLVRMHFGDDLQTLAHRFLGNEDRWIEIAIANSLKPPYVDEIGQRVSLLSNGSGNQLNIAATDAEDNLNVEKFYVGQAIFLSSDTVKFPEQRNIINIREIPISGELVFELDGENDLDRFKIAENAVIRVYLPNTVNSAFLVLIPTPAPPNAQVGKTPFFLSDKSEDEKRAGVDLSINQDFDLVFTPTSDFQISFGVPNAVQAMRIKMVSEKGQNKRHEAFGIASIMGNKLDQPEEVRQVLIASITDMIEADNRFDRVENLGISQVDGSFLVNIEVRMAGTGTVVPISFTVNTG